jgi:MFS family permease
MNKTTKEATSSKEYKAGGAGAGYILTITTLLFVVNYMDRQMVAAVVEPMKAALGLNDSDMGIIGTVFGISCAVFAFPISYLVDRWSRRKAIGIMALLWSLFTFLTGLGHNMVSILIPRSLVAVGETGFSAGGTAMIGAAYEKKSRGMAMGIFNMAVPIGIVLGSVLGGTLAKLWGWQAPFFFFAIPGVILAILAFFMKDYKSLEGNGMSGAKMSFGQSTMRILRIPTIVWVFIGYGISNIMAMSFIFWAPAFIQRAWGVDVQAANNVFAPIMLCAIVAAPIGGFLGDLWFKKNPRGRLYIPAISIIAASLALVAALFLELKGPLGMGLAIAYGFLNVMGLGGLSAVSQDVAPAAQKGLIFGMMVFAMYFLGGGWAPYLVGAISNAFGQGAQALGTAMSIASLGGIVGGICYFIATRTYVADMDKVKDDHLLAEK